MSYNIDSIDIVSEEGFRLPVEHIDRLRKEIGDEHPESWLFDELPPGGYQHYEERDSYLYFRALWWNGEGSGYTFDALKEKILPCFQGSADLVICWEGGDSYTGLRVRDGKVTAHEVVMKLGKEKR